MKQTGISDEINHDKAMIQEQPYQAKDDFSTETHINYASQILRTISN